MNILLIEDNEMFAKIAQSILRPHHLTHKTSLSEGLFYACEHAYEIHFIFLDLKLPDSQEPRDTVRQAMSLGIPVVVLSAYISPDLIRFAEGSNIVGFVEKQEFNKAKADEVLRKLQYSLLVDSVNRGEITEEDFITCGFAR